MRTTTREREAQGVVNWTDEKRWWRLYVARYLKDFEPKNVRTIDVEKVLNDGFKKGLSRESLKKVRSECLRIFNYAERADLVVKNPAKQAKLPRIDDDPRERAQLTPQEFLKYVSHPDTLN